MATHDNSTSTRLKKRQSDVVPPPPQAPLKLTHQLLTLLHHDRVFQMMPSWHKGEYRDTESYLKADDYFKAISASFADVWKVLQWQCNPRYAFQVEPNEIMTKKIDELASAMRDANKVLFKVIVRAIGRACPPAVLGFVIHWVNVLAQTTDYENRLLSHHRMKYGSSNRAYSASPIERYLQLNKDPNEESIRSLMNAASERLGIAALKFMVENLSFAVENTLSKACEKLRADNGLGRFCVEELISKALEMRMVLRSANGHADTAQTVRDLLYQYSRFIDWDDGQLNSSAEETAKGTTRSNVLNDSDVEGALDSLKRGREALFESYDDLRDSKHASYFYEMFGTDVLYHDELDRVIGDHSTLKTFRELSIDPVGPCGTPPSSAKVASPAILEPDIKVSSRAGYCHVEKWLDAVKPPTPNGRGTMLRSNVCIGHSGKHQPATLEIRAMRSAAPSPSAWDLNNENTRHSDGKRSDRAVSLPSSSTAHTSHSRRKRKRSASKPNGAAHPQPSSTASSDPSRNECNRPASEVAHESQPTKSNIRPTAFDRNASRKKLRRTRGKRNQAGGNGSAQTV